MYMHAQKAMRRGHRALIASERIFTVVQTFLEADIAYTSTIVLPMDEYSSHTNTPGCSINIYAIDRIVTYPC
jgi:hypothetical protein